MVSWPLVHCLLVVFHVRAHLHTGETRSELFAAKCHMFPSVLLSILFPAYSLIFQHKGYESKYKSWLYFSTKGMNWGLKLLYLLVLKWSQSCLSGELSNLSGTLLCEHQDSFFKYIYPWEDVGGPEKDWVMLQAKEISVLSPHILLARCISLGIIVTHLAWTAHKLESLNKPTK